MRIVLFGKNGQLGREFQKTLPALGEVFSMGREDLDIASHWAIKDILTKLKPDLIINASAYTAVDLAETQVELATKINSVAPGVMADAAHHLNAAFIHFSTDYVFDGNKKIPYTENDITNPLNVYGKSKLAGEKNVIAAGDACLIFRTSWVYSLSGNSFVIKVLEWSRKNKTLKIVNDQVGSPTWARMLAESVSRILVQDKADLLDAIREKHGIYHLAGIGSVSRYEWARQILAFDPRRTEQLVQSVDPAPSSEFPTPAVRPAFSALDCTRFTNTFKLSLPAWADALQKAMTESHAFPALGLQADS